MVSSEVNARLLKPIRNHPFMVVVKTNDEIVLTLSHYIYILPFTDFSWFPTICLAINDAILVGWVTAHYLNCR